MRGFLSFIVLRLISKEHMSGEDLRLELEKRKGTKPSPGTIYPVLKSLAENGFIVECPDCGKEKKYQATAAGKKELERATKHFVSLFCDMKDEFK